MTALGLVAGFALGAGCAVELLFLMRKAAAWTRKPARTEPESGEAGTPDEDMAFEKQLENMLNYDGRPKKREQVNADED
jgi:hypothetical protein